jgi:hypothetical protein
LIASGSIILPPFGIGQEENMPGKNERSLGTIKNPVEKGLKYLKREGLF